MAVNAKQVCPLCCEQATVLNTFLLLGIKESQTLKCHGCGLYFRDPLPDQWELAQYYRANYFRYPDAIQQTMADIQSDWIISRMANQRVRVSQIKYIEFGAGRGWLINRMKNRGASSAFGYEPDIDSVEFGRESFGIDLRQGFVTDMLLDEINDVFLENETPLLSLVHVLEHLHAPIDTLTALRKKFPMPYLFIEVPDAQYEGPVMALDTFEQSSMGQHFWSFTQESLTELLNKTGFSVISIEKGGASQFWDYELVRLNMWAQLSNLYKKWQTSSFNLKDGVLNLARLILSVLAPVLKKNFGKIFGISGYSRVDVPVIRVLAFGVSNPK